MNKEFLENTAYEYYYTVLQIYNNMQELNKINLDKDFNENFIFSYDWNNFKKLFSKLNYLINQKFTLQNKIEQFDFIDEDYCYKVINNLFLISNKRNLKNGNLK